MTDHVRRAAERHAFADPTAAIVEAARVDDSGPAIRLLADLDRWDAAPHSAKDAAAYAVAGSLDSEVWGAWRMEEFECSWRRAKWDQCESCDGYSGASVTARDRGQPLEPGEWTQGDCVLAACSDCAHLRGVVRHRVAVFVHRPTGAEFTLCPGRRNPPSCASCQAMGVDPLWNPGDPCHCPPLVPPLLVARTPITVHQAWIPRGNEPFGDPEHTERPMVERSVKWWLDWCAEAGGLRPPAETEWCHAALAGAPTRFPWGDEVNDRYVWHVGNSSRIEQVRGYVEIEPVETLEGLLQKLIEASNIIYNRTLTPSPHAVTEHLESRAWNAVSIVDLFGNVWEYLEDGTVIGGSARTPRSSFLRGIPHGQAQSENDTGFRPVSDLP